MTPHAAMLFASEKHKTQTRRYTFDPYIIHPGEVAGIVATSREYEECSISTMVSVAWLHDVMEDCDVSSEELRSRFGLQVAQGVLLLSDLAMGSRAERKAATRSRLKDAPAWVNTIKCADIISNARTIRLHAPQFAITYCAETKALLKVMKRVDVVMHQLALDAVKD